MSIEALKWAFEQDDVPPGPRFVLVALANRANEEGGDCYPSIAWIRRKTGFSDSTVREHLSALETQYRKLSKAERQRDDGGKSSNLYQLHLIQTADTPPAEIRRGVPPIPGGGTTEIRRGPPPKSGGHKTKDLKQDLKQKSLVEELPDWVPANWHDFVADRKERGKKMTELAQKLALETLAKLRAEGHDPEAVIRQSIERGYSGLFPIKGDRNSFDDIAAHNRRVRDEFLRDQEASS